MAKTNRRRNYTRAFAIGVHALANNSDPFAAQNMAHHLSKHPKETKAVAEESERLFNVKAARIQRRGSADWLSVEQVIALNDLRADLVAWQKRSRKYAGARTGRMKAAA